MNGNRLSGSEVHVCVTISSSTVNDLVNSYAKLQFTVVVSKEMPLEDSSSNPVPPLVILKVLSHADVRVGVSYESFGLRRSSLNVFSSTPENSMNFVIETREDYCFIL